MCMMSLRLSGVNAQISTRIRFEWVLVSILTIGGCDDSNESPVRPDVEIERETIINRSEYRDKLRGFWLGSSIANWTGLTTENERSERPFFSDEDWSKPLGRDGAVIDYVLDSDPWLADDDTDIEYVYQRAMEQYATHLLSAEQIASAWRSHIGLPQLWVSNLAALGQMQNGALPPATSLPENNPMWDMIDAQLTTELFGALAPARPDVALQMAHLPIRTTAYLHSEWAAEFYVIMHSLVPLADRALSRAQQLEWMAEQARARIPDWSYIADMYDFVRTEHEQNQDKDDWEQTRDKLYQRYQVNGAAGYEYKYPWDSGINFGASIISLLYGEGDYKKTIRIGTLAGWDSDNPTATWGGLLGLMMGHAEIAAYFGKDDFSDAYLIASTRYNFDPPLDNFSDIAASGVDIIDRIVITELGGRLDGDNWIIPDTNADVVPVPMLENEVPWQTIEDDDPRWTLSGFRTNHSVWNASGATLTTGKADCNARITFNGTAVQYYAYRSPTSGTVNILLDGMPVGNADLASNTGELGQYYVKVFERTGLEAGRHDLEIVCDGNPTDKSIDMLSVTP